MAKEERRLMEQVKSVRKPSGIKNDGTPNVPWNKFQKRLSVYNLASIQDWKPEHFLGHILKRYIDVYGINYSLSYSGPPSKCSEIYCIKRMMSFLGGENPDPLMVKEYIDWTYDSIIIPKKMQVESLALFFSSKLIREFKSKYKKSKKITRSTTIPPQYQDFIHGLGYDDISTYGDLAFIKMALDQSQDYNQDYRNLFIELTSRGFDTGQLEYLE